MGPRQYTSLWHPWSCSCGVVGSPLAPDTGLEAIIIKIDIRMIDGRMGRIVDDGLVAFWMPAIFRYMPSRRRCVCVFSFVIINIDDAIIAKR
jgi:hypothetical protein